MINLTLSNNIASQEANVLTRNLLHEIQKVEEKFQPQDKKWADETLNVLRFCVGAGNGLSLGTIYTLYIYKTHWDDLPIEFRREYNYQFNMLVVRETPVKPETLDNYFRTVKTYIVEGKKPFGTIEVPKRDQYRNLIVEDGEIITEQKEFDPLEIPITKLTLMRSAVENNEMTDKRWSMLVDPDVRTSEIQAELYKRDDPGDPDPSMQYKLMGDVIIAQELGKEVVIGRLDFSQYGDNELVTNAIKHLLRCLGVKPDMDVIQTIKKHGFLERYQKEGDDE